MAEMTEITKIADQLILDGSQLHKEWSDIDEMYFMDPTALPRMTGPMQDKDDVKTTISPIVRNAVVGLVRLLTTNEPHFTAKSKTGSQKLTQIEDLCDVIWRESGAAKRADLHVDAVRSAALYSDVHIVGESVDDLIETVSDEEKQRLQDIRKRTPFLLEVRQPAESYPLFGRFGLRGLLRRYQTTGDDLNGAYKPSFVIGDSERPYVSDWFGMKDRVVWVEGHDSQPLMNEPHGLPELPIGISLADGSELWRLEEKRRQPFLYSMWKGELWKRHTGVLTAIFTSLNERGTGVLVGFDDSPDRIEVNFAGPGVRYITAPKPRILSDSAFDPNLVGLLNNVLGPLTDASTIYPQTLGSNEGMNSTTFSSLALMSQSGQLPTVPIRKAVIGAMQNVYRVILRWIKREGISLDGISDLKPSDIPDDIDLDIDLEIKLPQDMFKNIQVAETAVQMGLASKEWVHTNLMQLHDSTQMIKDIWGEQTAQQYFTAMLQQQIQKMFTPPTPTTPTAPSSPDQSMPPGGDQGTPPGTDQSMSPSGDQGMLPGADHNTPTGGDMTGGTQSPGGSQAAQAGGGILPMTQPIGSKMRKPKLPRGR
jgi:hypothetical protein